MRQIWSTDESPELPLWKYFRPERFAEALASRRLYFASATQFEDPFEGAVAVLPHDWPVDPRYAEPEMGERAFEQLRRLAKVSCWHQADYESDAMWKLYASSRMGVAVRTTVSRLTAALEPFRLAPRYAEEEPWCGSVKYVDLRAVRLRSSMEERFFYKHRAFEWEREFRVMISLRLAEEYGVSVPGHGIEVGFDPGELCEEVYVGPSLTPDERTAVRHACIAAGIGERVRISTILGRPRYT
jgi:hypothetical protein